jgi:hypothetical protein
MSQFNFLIRVCGKKFAELPLIGTRVQYRRQGMCRLIMNELEKVVTSSIYVKINDSYETDLNSPTLCAHLLVNTSDIF